MPIKQQIRLTNAFFVMRQWCVILSFRDTSLALRDKADVFEYELRPYITRSKNIDNHKFTNICMDFDRVDAYLKLKLSIITPLRATAKIEKVQFTHKFYETIRIDLLFAVEISR